ncbi:MAG: hypothetical protein HYY06_07785 [Deltaproteobacteria bacterium]|nr:hypothetical protein [Deltaproteobacteria bacterium]
MIDRCTALCLLLAACGAQEAGDQDMGPIESALDPEDRVSWPGLDRSDGRVIPFLRAFGEGVPAAYWFLGFGSRRTADSFWFCREGDASCPLDGHRRLDWSSLAGRPIFTRVPGDPDYSPFWRAWVVTVPPDYLPDSVKTIETLDSLTRAGVVRVEPFVLDFGELFGERIGPREVVLHCALALAGTLLENAGGEMPDGSGPILAPGRRRAWFEGRRVELFDFSETDGVLPAANDSEERALVRVANIYILWRACEGEPRPAICELPGLAAGDRRPVSERGLGQDITGDLDSGDTNNVTGSAPCELARLTERPYSPLWAPLAVDLPAGAGVGLIDTYADEARTDILSADDMFDMIAREGLGMPVEMREDETGNPVPGNDGKVLYNCPMVVREGFVPFPCEDNT